VANRLISTSTGASLSYDALGRLAQTTSSTGVATQFLYDGGNIIGEYSASGAVLQRYVFGPGDDEPLVWYAGSGVTNRTWLLADQQGSVVATTNSAGAVVATETIAATQGSNTYTWDGEGADGSTEPDGTYTFSLTGPTNTGTIGSNLTFDVIGAATGVTDNSGTIDLQIGSLTTPFTNVQAVGN